ERAFYRHMISYWPRPDIVVRGPGEPPSLLNSLGDSPHPEDFVARMMLVDLVTYLPDDILAKVDRASMGVSLEARVPLLDHRLVEYAWTLPTSLKVRNGEGKWRLKQVSYKYVPRELVDRPKMGFSLPLDQWLRGPLRGWASDLLDAARLAHEGYFDVSAIREKWTEHLEGKRNWQYPLWTI